jgi:phosphatidylethanolamine-binding protein (PEBP) family uncharacterized protein
VLKRFFIGCATLGLFAAAAVPASAFGLRFSWAGIPACAVISPQFTLSDVPPGTRFLDFEMIDLDAPTFHHGGSIINYTTGIVPMGAIRYIGPCPPIGQRHRYVWSVDATSAEGHRLGSATAAGTFPP